MGSELKQLNDELLLEGRIQGMYLAKYFRNILCIEKAKTESINNVRL